MTDKIELVILRSLLHRQGYTRRVLPFLKDEYFHDNCEKRLFKTISEFVNKYTNAPTREALNIILNQQEGMSQGEFDECIRLVDGLSASEEEPEEQWLVDQTEKFCKDKAVYNALMESVELLDEKKAKGRSTNAIPGILSKALSVSFDQHIGHDFIEDAEQRYEFYHRIEKKTPFDLDYFNRITGGGVPDKTLNVVLAGTGVGKSLFMCHHAANCLTQNKNVLYITCEMAEERIAERIDANLMDVTLDDLKHLPIDVYGKKLAKLTKNITGKLIIKEYPTASASVNHFRHLMDELRLKKNFKPDVVFIDYLNICASSRFKPGANVNSYTYIKAIAEELRGMAVEMGVPIFTATQTNRSGFSNTDVDLTDTSESFGLPATADFMFAIIATEQLDELGQVMVKQLKNRYNDTATNRKFVIGIDRAKMKLFDVEDSMQQLVDSKPKSGYHDADEEDEEPRTHARTGKHTHGHARTRGMNDKFDDWT
jgi:replicative DNA helicase